MSVCSFVQSQSAPSSSQSPSSSSQPSNLSTLNEKPILTLKTSPKQVLMLNSNRLSLSPGSQTPEQTLSYSSKKSPTILILSKPKNELSPKSLVHKPPKSSSNLISSYFNKQNSISGSNTTSISPSVQSHSHHLSNLPIQFMPNSKPITLIPIGKLASNSNASNFNDNSFNSLIPIETIEISTATIEINSTNETSADLNNENAKPSVEPKVEPPVEQPEKQEIAEPKPEPISQKIDVTRCICEMDHDDGFMICCDSCLVWQHIACMEVNKKKIPDKFYCEKCNPRAINAQRARQIQEKYLKNLSKNLNKLKNRRHSNSSSAAMTPAGENESIDEPMDEANVMSPADSDHAESRKQKKRFKSRTIREEFEVKKPDDADHDTADKLRPLDIGSLSIAQNSTDLLKLAKVKCSKKSDEIEETKYRVKLTQAMQKDRIICEYVGLVMLNSDTSDTSTIADCFNYTFKVPISGESKPSTSSSSSSSTANLVDLETITVCIDSSKVFNNSRYIRKSCRSNSKLVPVKDMCGNLKFFLQTTESIGKNSEIFLAPDANNLNNSICLCESIECELRQKFSCKATKKSVKKPERRLSAHSPPPHDESFKCLSREDRKLASYVRVIEKLEKQVKRKKETKSRDHSEKCDPIEKCSKETNEKENDKNKKSKSSRPSLLNKHEQATEPVDQEIASINEKPALDDEPKPSVKSPDYSFVNLSIQPRHTLNLLKRNLTNDERFSPAFESLENNQTFLTNKSFFHPKKHWLRTCCSNEDSQTDVSPSKSESSQPPKKRRFVVEQSSSESNSIQQNEPNEPVQQQTSNTVFSAEQFYINYMPPAIMSSPFFATTPIFGPFNPYAALSMYQNMIPVMGQPSESQPEKKKVSLAEYRQRKESVKLSDAMFESISSNKSFSNDDSLCELDVYPTEGKDSPHTSCSSCSSRRASLSNISDVSSVRSRSPSNSSQRSQTSRFESCSRVVKRKYRSCSTSRLQVSKSNEYRNNKRSSSLNRPRKICQIETKCLNKKSLGESFGSCSSSSSIYSSNDVAKTQL